MLYEDSLPPPRKEGGQLFIFHVFPYRILLIFLFIRLFAEYLFFFAAKGFTKK